MTCKSTTATKWKEKFDVESGWVRRYLYCPEALLAHSTPMSEMPNVGSMQREWFIFCAYAYVTILAFGVDFGGPAPIGRATTGPPGTATDSADAHKPLSSLRHRGWFPSPLSFAYC